MIGLALGAVEIGGALGVTKYVGFKEGLIGFGSLVVVGRALGMEFKGSLEALQGLFDLVSGVYIVSVARYLRKDKGRPGEEKEACYPICWALDLHGVRGLYQPLRQCSPRARG